MAYFEIGHEERGIEVSVPFNLHPRCPGIDVHRRRNLKPRHLRVDGPIRVTNPILTLVDFAASHGRDEVEEAINAADRASLVSVARLRIALDQYAGRPGAPLLRHVLDRRTFRMTQSRLERLFIPIALGAGLGRPLTQQWLNGFRVDFFWPGLGLVSRRMDCVTSARPRSKRGTVSATRRTQRRD